MISKHACICATHNETYENTTRISSPNFPLCLRLDSNPHSENAEPSGNRATLKW